MPRAPRSTPPEPAASAASAATAASATSTAAGAPAAPATSAASAGPATAAPHGSAGRWVARRCLVSGRVQGVYYRASARERARAGGVRGHARNLPDGRVEVLAYGEAAAVQAFIEWLWVGPAAARVSAVLIEELQLETCEPPADFRTG